MCFFSLKHFAPKQILLVNGADDCAVSVFKHLQGRSQDFSKGGGGHTGSNNIVMAFSPRNIVGYLLKNAYKGGVTGTPGPPLATPLT